MKKWDYDVKIIGLSEDRIEEVLDKIEEIARAECLRVEFGLGVESEEK